MKKLITIALAVIVVLTLGLLPAVSASADPGSIVGLWHLNELSGATTVVDSSGYGNNGAVVGGVTLGVPGVFGAAASFNGASGYISVASPSGLPTGSSPRTISLWFKWSEVKWPSPGIEIMGYGANANFQRLGIWIDGTHALGVETCNYARVFHWDGDTNWHQLTVVYPSGQTLSDKFQLYFDGVLRTDAYNIVADGVSAPGTLNTASSPLAIGVLPIPTLYYFNGTIDEVRIWNVALTADEIAAYYSLPIDIKPGSSPNSINLSDQGLLPVAILGSAGFDVHNIDLNTIELGGVGLASRGSAKAPKLAYSYEDVNLDGYMDLMVFFSVPQLVLDSALTSATTALSLTASTNGGLPLAGTDTVSIVPPQ